MRILPHRTRARDTARVMSRENVEIAMEAFRRFDPNDLDEWTELWHPESRLTAPDGWPELGPFVGLGQLSGRSSAYSSRAS